ncbi:hypothetical protein XENOCAPTIV_029966 [Xenoophorus captivus]|uniref:TcmA/NAT10 helicase domain-containing protein n=1 Tax=Xenoophorus captivus TaxID=1517983 RepID=A0ABV0QBU6_9TELE
MATVRKKVDNRIRVQIENGVTLQHRTMFVVVGDRGRDQDFEALTPNLLARTIETVEGGGIVVILLRTMNSLKQLYTMTMDVHSRYRTEAHQDVVGRFNERYEGTGRSLSLKLIQQLRQQSAESQQNLSAGNRNTNTARLAAARTLHEVSLHESIRYAPGDAVEKWLNELLCLDCLNIPRLISGCPLPQSCDLYPSFSTS